MKIKVIYEYELSDLASVMNTFSYGYEKKEIPKLIPPFPNGEVEVEMDILDFDQAEERVIKMLSWNLDLIKEYKITEFHQLN